MSDLLIIDDDRALCRSLQIQLKRNGHRAEMAHTGRDGLSRISDAVFDLVLLDLGLPDEDGLDVLRQIVKTCPGQAVAVITARQAMHAAVAAMRDGAFDYVRKPFELAELLLIVEKAARRQDSGTSSRNAVAPSEPALPHEIIGTSRTMLGITKQIGLLARTRVTVLITGESGTGKELVARALHDAGAGRDPFVAVNCSAVVPTLFESELFGHEKGAFTGADSRRIGKLEHAADGTIFFDEIGDMPLDLQAKLLRALQERTFERVGGNEPVALRARVVAATNRDLQQMVAEGTFREDLYYRLAVSPVHVPALREHRGDIRAIAAHILGQRARELHSRVQGISDAALRRLEDYDWPGNVRELENALTRAIALARTAALGVEDFAFLTPGQRATSAELGEPRPLWQAEKLAIDRALAYTNGNITQAAGLLDISRTTLRKKIRDYGTEH